ncbi:COG4705 family protein [Sphingomonas sp. YL-JM2C]
MRDQDFPADSKLPAVTLGFWIIKILATTLGETGGDTVSMTMNLGYLAGTGIFLTLLLILVGVQMAARRFVPSLYWLTIIASTMAGTTMADFATRSMGIGYAGGSALLLVCVLGSLLTWYRSLGSVAVDQVRDSGTELFYWITITFSQTLGTALGDWLADTGGLGYVGAGTIFGGLLAGLALLYLFTPASRVMLFWAAFILTRPLGATVGDFLDKPIDHGGLDFSRPLASAVLAGAIVLLILTVPQRAGSSAPAAGRLGR